VTPDSSRRPQRGCESGFLDIAGARFVPPSDARILQGYRLHADAGEGVTAFADKGDLWQRRRGLARDFWSDGGER